jgi:hypothetical protein
MANLSTPSEGVEQQTNNKELTIDTQNRVTAVANQAIEILDRNPDAKEAVKDLFNKMIAGNMRDPENVFKLQKWLFDARDARLADMKPSEKLGALKSFSQFMERFTEQLARINGSIPLSNEAHAITAATQAKIENVKATYAGVLSNNHPTQSA